jgi:uncharacterized protein (TIGR02466 family)
MELLPTFSTPIWMSVYPDFEEHKTSFLTCVRNFKENNPQGEHKSNIAGYQSPFTLQGEEELRPLFQYVCEMAIQAVQDLNFIPNNIFLTHAWVNFNDSRECMNSEHVHGEVFSGVFYLKVPPNSGKLVLNNSAMNRLWSGCSLIQEKNQFTGEQMKIEPEEGSIILFPAYLPHSVETNSHDDERISISFNLMVLPEGQFAAPPQ